METEVDSSKCLKSASTQVSLHSTRLKLTRGKLPNSAVIKVGSRLIELRQLSTDILVNCAGSQTEIQGDRQFELSSCQTVSSNGVNSPSPAINATTTAVDFGASTHSTSNLNPTEEAEVEKRRKRWRLLNRRRRGVYAQNSDTINSHMYNPIETLEQRSVRLEKMKEKSSLNRKQFSKEKLVEMRKNHQVYKKEKLASETNNQRFWRLLLRRQHRRKRYHNLILLEQYERSIGKYGLELRTSGNVQECTDKNIKEQLSLFYELLHDARNGRIISLDETHPFLERGIHFPENFYHEFLTDEISVEANSDSDRD